MSRLSAWNGAGRLGAVLAGALWLATASAQDGGTNDPRSPSMWFGPVDGFTTAFHAVPVEADPRFGGNAGSGPLAMPVARTVEFQVRDLPLGEWVRWDATGKIGPRESFAFTRTGMVSVSCTLMNSGTRMICPVSVLPIEPDDLGASGSIRRKRTQELGTGPHDLTAMELYFRGGSVGELSPWGDDFAVSLENLLHLDGSTALRLLGRNRANLEALVEWRVDGEARGIGDLDFASLEPGLRTLEVGPAGLGERFRVYFYRTEITADSAGGEFPDDVPITFTAATEPPGFESLLTWIAATKFGEAAPELGNGSTFTTTFHGTTGPYHEGGTQKWVGAACDEQRSGYDRKCRDTANLLDPNSVPPANYPRLFLAIGEVQVFAPDSNGAVIDLLFAPPEDPAHPYVPFQDFVGRICESGEGEFQCNRSGLYMVLLRQQFADTLLAAFVATAAGEKEKQDDSPTRAIAKPTDDVVIVECPPDGQDNGYDQNAKDGLTTETGVKDLDGAAKAICDAFTKKGAKVSVHAVGHGTSANFSIGAGTGSVATGEIKFKPGTKVLTDESKAFLAKIKDKVSTFKLFGCAVASGACGPDFLQAVADASGAKICAFDQNVQWGGCASVNRGAKEVEKSPK